jgi:hypothetical protein
MDLPRHGLRQMDDNIATEAIAARDSRCHGIGTKRHIL